MTLLGSQIDKRGKAMEKLNFFPKCSNNTNRKHGAIAIFLR